jgi:flagellar basal-body rod protein FlgC
MTMDYSTTFAICAAGMAAERTRVDVATLNLANANTIQDAHGLSYRPLRALIRAVPVAGDASAFSDQVDRGLGAPTLTDASGLTLPQAAIESANAEPRLVYEPGNPFANDKGFVAYAAVDTATEMVTMLSATRSYEANVAAMNMAKTLALRALDIGSTS